MKLHLKKEQTQTNTGMKLEKRENGRNSNSEEKKVSTYHKNNASKKQVAGDCGGGNCHMHYRSSYKYCNKRSKPSK